MRSHVGLLIRPRRVTPSSKSRSIRFRVGADVTTLEEVGLAIQFHQPDFFV
jgi:hypothetical protein